MLYGLGNIVENAVDFAKERVDLAVKWTDEDVLITIADDGPGFAPEIIERLGEPYVTSRPARRSEDNDESGFGLGFFIAKTLLERSGATLTFENKTGMESGAIVEIHWTRIDFQARRDLSRLDTARPPSVLD